MPIAAVRYCATHAARPAYAVCMSCRKTLCQECATQWEGIWHCSACLAARRTSAKTSKGVPLGWIAVASASLLIFYLSARMMVWSGALLASLQ